MFNFEVTGIRVRYADTDQMGYVYYGNYARYYEIGRVEALRALGFHYKEMEQSGVMMPVYDLHCKFHLPARYDDLLAINVKILRPPSVRVYFEYEIRNQDKVLLNTGSTTLVFQNMHTGKLCQCPDDLQAKLRPFFLEANEWLA
ncbi:MAG: thioesterase [Cytophagaceae bacterium SCN 52-12]|nr:MAG: thioesterase [Cytophagaceae bacterium SCN 52-12]